MQNILMNEMGNLLKTGSSTIMPLLNVFDIFKSINGEVTASHQGSFCTFIRLGGCNLKCTYCDTPATWDVSSSKKIPIAQILEKVKELKCKKVTITGGEPLLQDRIWDLFGSLSYLRYEITVETNGSRHIPSYFSTLSSPVHSWVVDYKLPSSGYEDQMNVSYVSLRKQDFVKFGILTEEDLKQAKVISRLLKASGCEAQMAFSSIVLPDTKMPITPKRIFDYLTESGINDAIINIQIHKYFEFA